jgi:hypothetical protein
MIGKRFRDIDGTCRDYAVLDHSLMASERFEYSFSPQSLSSPDVGGVSDRSWQRRI